MNASRHRKSLPVTVIWHDLTCCSRVGTCEHILYCLRVNIAGFFPDISECCKC